MATEKAPILGLFQGFSIGIGLKNFLFLFQNRQFVFTRKIQYKLVAKRSEANLSNLQFPTWCPGWGSNPHLLRDTILSRARIPFRHPGIFGRPTFLYLEYKNVIGGVGGNRTRACRFCRPKRYHFATTPILASLLC